MRKIDWKPYFVFSKRDRIAAIVLLVLIVVFFITPFFYHPFASEPVVVIGTLEQELAKQNAGAPDSANEQITIVPAEENGAASSRSNTVELFLFDPNTLDAAGFRRLGLRDRTISTIINYRNKGGHFWKAQDLRKIYGLQKEEADRLIPYIRIAGQQQPLAKNYKAATNFAKPTPAIIDINTATVEQWKVLPAIGDVLSNRIVKFRNKIGGFTSIAQVKQTYGLSDSAFRAIAPYLSMASTAQKTNVVVSQETVTLGKMNINTASVNQLKSNSHIPEQVAQAIVIYRSQHGNFATIEDIKKIVFVNEEMYKEIAPYLTVGQ